MAKARHIAPFPTGIDREAFGNWLSGFADGEATFLLRLTRSQRRGSFNCQAYFRIALRDDDDVTLRMIQSFWICGRMHHSDNRRSKIANAKPIAIFDVSCVADLVGTVIPHFERFPLRAKKRHDFLIWRKAVELMAEVQKRKYGYAYRGGRKNCIAMVFPKWKESDWDQIRSLVAELRAQRRYPVTESPIAPCHGPESNGNRPAKEPRGKREQTLPGFDEQD